MADITTIIDLTKEAAAFSAREYFRPIIAIMQAFKQREPLLKVREINCEERAGVEETKAILREWIVTSRHREKLLLTQFVVAAFAIVLSLTIFLLYAFQMDRVFILAVIPPIGLFAIWMAFRVVRNRETIVEAKTIYRLMKSIDSETAERVVKQVTWPAPKRPRKRGKDKRLH